MVGRRAEDAGACRRRVCAARQALQDLGALGHPALLDHRDVPVECRAAPRARSPECKEGRKGPTTTSCTSSGSMLAGRRESGAKLLQRALDRRHGLSIKQYARRQGEERCAGCGTSRSATAIFRRILGAAQSSGRERGGREEGVPGRPHAVASRRRRQSGGHSPAAATGRGHRPC